jgi:hypothetical protein
MTITEAAAQSGLSPYTLKAGARAGAFEADMPRGRRGGWEINSVSFAQWLLRRRARTGNAPARARAIRELQSTGSSL